MTSSGTILWQGAQGTPARNAVSPLADRAPPWSAVCTAVGGMPRGYSVRRPEPFCLALAVVEIADGAELIDSLREVCAEWSPNPAIIFSALGTVQDARLRVPKDEAVDELLRDEQPFGVAINSPDFRLEDVTRFEDPSAPIEDPPPGLSLDPQPHWYVDEEYPGEPLTLLYAHGGMAKPTSTPNYHLVVSGSASRPGGRGEAFVGLFC
jgi:hypothetical protein